MLDESLEDETVYVLYFNYNDRDAKSSTWRNFERLLEYLTNEQRIRCFMVQFYEIYERLISDIHCLSILVM